MIGKAQRVQGSTGAVRDACSMWHTSESVNDAYAIGGGGWSLLLSSLILKGERTGTIFWGEGLNVSQNSAPESVSRAIARPGNIRTDNKANASEHVQSAVPFFSE